ncbi:uncharacterized protein LOC114523663 [Dendronephthya gigantea]|uniref:uncharacterized protein LOC114523663 n=1 Tax=Dendronephthya gigantea TaxID=151771 RepID=UPI00106D81AE|nr:uncharacterized protein LOC114523663 [Dendronephthya gigantea]
MNMFESKHTRNKRLFTKRSKMFGAKEGHTIFCEEDCAFTHHEMLLSLVLSKRNDPKTFDRFKECVRKELASGWNRDSDIADNAKYFRFPLVHWAAVYGKLFALQWLIDQDFDVEVTNKQGETALHRLVACQAHERAVDPRIGRGRRYSLGNIIQVFSKVLNIFTSKCPQLLLRYDYVQRDSPFSLCLKLLLENIDTCPRLVQYHQTLFKILCERLVALSKQQKLCREFIHNGFSLKDCQGQTIWHLAASCRNETVTSGLNLVLNAIEGFDLTLSNNNYETPILVALKSGNQEFAAMIEAYKYSNCEVPVVKMEMFSDSEKDECCCEHHNNAFRSKVEQPSCGKFQQGTSCCNGSCVNSSNNNTSLEQSASLIPDDQSFTENLGSAPIVEQEKVVLTNPDNGDDPLHLNDAQSQSSDDIASLSTNQESASCDNDLLNETCDQEEIVIEKQIDLCLSLSQSMESSDSTTTEDHASNDLSAESDQVPRPDTLVESNPPRLNILAEALRQADVSDNEVFVERFDPESVNQNIDLPTPPDSSTSPEQGEQTPQTPLDEPPKTPPPKETAACRGISVTPVLLIKLLSEPDVSEKFQSLLKDVITGDTAKVDSTQTTMQGLRDSKVKLDLEISSSKAFIENIRSKTKQLLEEIQKLQEEVCKLQSSEEAIKIKLLELNDEQIKVTKKIEECESTCSHLKRRLSDCTGALVGLSPKSQKRC